MAWPARTWIAGETETSTIFNSYVRDELSALAIFDRGGSLYTSAGISAAVNLHVWLADRACRVQNVKGLRAGGTGATINARRTGPPVAQVWRVTAVGPVYVDETADFNNSSANDVQPFPTSEAVNDYFAVGCAAQPRSLRIVIGTQGVGASATVVWEYWNGSAWTALSSVSDGTGAFKSAAGTYNVTWAMPGDWATCVINGSASLYYVRARLSAGSYTTDPLLTQGWEGYGEHLASAKSLTNADTWMDGGSVQNTDYQVSDKMEIMIVSVAGSPTQVAVLLPLTHI